MRKLTSSDLKELGLLKHYRIIRKWACKINELNDAFHKKEKTELRLIELFKQSKHCNCNALCIDLVAVNYIIYMFILYLY